MKKLLLAAICLFIFAPFFAHADTWTAYYAAVEVVLKNKSVLQGISEIGGNTVGPGICFSAKNNASEEEATSLPHLTCLNPFLTSAQIIRPKINDRSFWLYDQNFGNGSQAAFVLIRTDRDMCTTNLIPFSSIAQITYLLNRRAEGRKRLNQIDVQCPLAFNEPSYTDDDRYNGSDGDEIPSVTTIDKDSEIHFNPRLFDAVGRFWQSCLSGTEKPEIISAVVEGDHLEYPENGIEFALMQNAVKTLDNARSQHKIAIMTQALKTCHATLQKYVVTHNYNDSLSNLSVYFRANFEEDKLQPYQALIDQLDALKK